MKVNRRTVLLSAAALTAVAGCAGKSTNAVEVPVTFEDGHTGTATIKFARPVTDEDREVLSGYAYRVEGNRIILEANR